MRPQQTGDIVQGKVTEVVGDTGLIVSFQGQLMRLENRSQRVFEAGQSVELQVTQVRPLRFRLLENGPRRFERHI